MLYIPVYLALTMGFYVSAVVQLLWFYQTMSSKVDLGFLFLLAQNLSVSQRREDSLFWSVMDMYVL